MYFSLYYFALYAKNKGGSWAALIDEVGCDKSMLISCFSTKADSKSSVRLPPLFPN